MPKKTSLNLTVSFHSSAHGSLQMLSYIKIYRPQLALWHLPLFMVISSEVMATKPRSPGGSGDNNHYSDVSVLRGLLILSHSRSQQSVTEVGAPQLCSTWLCLCRAVRSMLQGLMVFGYTNITNSSATTTSSTWLGVISLKRTSKGQAERGHLCVSLSHPPMSLSIVFFHTHVCVKSVMTAKTHKN